MKKSARSLLLVVAASAALPLVSSSPNKSTHERGAIQLRALILPEASGTTPSDSATSAPTSTQPATSTIPSSSSAAVTTSSAPPTTSAAQSATPSSAGSTPPTTARSTSTPTTVTHPVETSAVATTDAAGQTITSFVQFTPSPSSPPPSATTSNSSSSGDSGGLGTGSIIGLSVAGGIAAIAIIAFFVWKFTRKRLSDFDDNEAIKWPELNAHNTDVHALPTNATGRAGFGPENDSDINLTRAPSPGAYANSIAAPSVPEAYGPGDPYAVPPLPHLNPNQPYRDEPGAYGQPAGYYDPYRGPVPNTFTDTISDGHGAESIPMTQMTGTRQMAYGTQGRASPAPQAEVGYANMDDATGTPGQAAPGAHAGYGYGSR